jgi:hypothetical protein
MIYDIFQPPPPVVDSEPAVQEETENEKLVVAVELNGEDKVDDEMPVVEAPPASNGLSKLNGVFNTTEVEEVAEGVRAIPVYNEWVLPTVTGRRPSARYQVINNYGCPFCLDKSVKLFRKSVRLRPVLSDRITSDVLGEDIDYWAVFLLGQKASHHAFGPKCSVNVWREQILLETCLGDYGCLRLRFGSVFSTFTLQDEDLSSDLSFAECLGGYLDLQHAAEVVNNKLYVIGGNHNGRYLNDVQVHKSFFHNTTHLLMFDFQRLRNLLQDFTTMMIPYGFPKLKS